MKGSFFCAAPEGQIVLTGKASEVGAETINSLRTESAAVCLVVFATEPAIGVTVARIRGTCVRGYTPDLGSLSSPKNFKKFQKFLA